MNAPRLARHLSRSTDDYLMSSYIEGLLIKNGVGFKPGDDIIFGFLKAELIYRGILKD